MGHVPSASFAQLASDGVTPPYGPSFPVGATLVGYSPTYPTVKAAIDALFTGTSFVFTVASFGAKGNTQTVTDGAMTSSSAVLTSATGLFAAGDVGKVVSVAGAGTAVGGAAMPLVATISSFQSATQVTLSASNTSGGNVSGATVYWGTDDTTAIQTCLNSASAARVAVEFGAFNLYMTTSDIVIPSNTVIRGNYAAICQVGISSGNLWGMSTQGSLNGGLIQNLTSDGLVGTYTVNISTTAGFNPGDFVLVGSAAYYPVGSSGALAGYNVNQGEILQIRSVVANTSITFCTPLLDTYAAANTAFVQGITFKSNIYINQLVFQGSNTPARGERGLVLEYVKDFAVINSRLMQQDIYQLELGSCIHGNVAGNHFYGCYYDGTHGTIFYGCAFLNTSQWINYYGNTGHRNRHHVVSTAFSTGQGFYGKPRFINWQCNQMYDDQSNAAGGGESYAYELHGFGDYINIEGNFADGCYAGVQMENGAHINVIGNNIVNYGSAAIVFGTAGAQFSNIKVANNITDRYTGDFSSSSAAAIRIETDSTVALIPYSNISITGNICSNCYNSTTANGTGVYISSPNGISISVNTVNTNATVTMASGTTAGLYAGMGISGTGIPLGATILAISSSSQFTISQNATATNSGVTLTVVPRTFQGVYIDDNIFESQPNSVANEYGVIINNLCDGIDVTNNKLINFQAGINIGTSSNCLIDGNKITIPAWNGTTFPPSTGFGIYVNGSRNVVQNNVIRGLNTAVRVDTNGYKNVVVSNTGSQVTTMLSDAGTGTVTTAGNNLLAG